MRKLSINKMQNEIERKKVKSVVGENLEAALVADKKIDSENVSADWWSISWGSYFAC